MKSGNDGNKCVSVTERLRIPYFRDFTGQKLLSYKLFGRSSIILQECFCREIVIDKFLEKRECQAGVV